jgi:hypothetical protein
MHGGDAAIQGCMAGVLGQRCRINPAALACMGALEAG